MYNDFYKRISIPLSEWIFKKIDVGIDVMIYWIQKVRFLLYKHYINFSLSYICSSFNFFKYNQGIRSVGKKGEFFKDK